MAQTNFKQPKRSKDTATPLDFILCCGALFLMIGHCIINDKPKPKEGMKPKKVEFENRGYWAKWYLAYDTKHAKELFKAEYPDGKYFRCRSY